MGVAEVAQIDQGQRTIQPARHSVSVLTSEWPTNLKTLDEAANDLGVSLDRLRMLTDGGYAPHFRIDGGPPLFRISELRRWAGSNLVQQVDGKDIPSPVKVIVAPEVVKDFRRVPSGLRQLAGLCDITDEIMRTGIYFLCRDGAVLYVGQSVNAAARITEHYRRYEFDTVFFLPWPGDDLNRIEAALIRATRPPLNGKGNNGTMRTSFGSTEEDNELLLSIFDSTMQPRDADDLNPRKTASS